MKQLTSYEGLHCANCGASMQGEFCHACGQSIHSVLKPMHGMVEEAVETVLHIDGRIVQTVPPLLIKPGFLTLEYFSGRRVRYIAPFRLMFVLCLLSFFVFHLAIDQITERAAARSHSVTVNRDTTEGTTAKGVTWNALTGLTVNSEAIDSAANPAQVRKELQDELKDLQDVLPLATQDQINSATQELQQKANQRLVALGATPMPSVSVAVPPATATVLAGRSGAAAHPVEIAWLPEVVNARLTELNRHFYGNVQAFKSGDPVARKEAMQRMTSGVFSALPPTMFVLIPVFAALLKLFYVFRRRLYMEHLIVALHSHAFLFLSLLLLTVTGMLSTWLHPHAAWTGYALGWVQALLILWIPAYLLLMQKRVYRQGWPMTVLKFWCIGWCYFWLLVLALVVAGALGMAH